MDGISNPLALAALNRAREAAGIQPEQEPAKPAVPLSTATVGGWTWYVRQVKAYIPDPESLDYKALLQKYISDVSWQTVVKELGGRTD